MKLILIAPLIYSILFISPLAFAKNLKISATCKVNAQKFGTTLICPENVYDMASDSAAEKFLFKTCEPDEECLVSFEVNEKDHVLKITSAKKIANTSEKTFPTSYDCAKAKSFVEKTTCLHEDVAKLDVQLDAVYKAALKESKTPDLIKKAQTNWIKKNRNKCSDIDCLKKEYSERIQSLQAAKGS